MQKNKKLRFSKLSFFLGGITVVIGSILTIGLAILVFFIKNPNAFKAIGVPFINRPHLLKIYKKIYTPEEFKAKYGVTAAEMGDSFMELAAAAVFSGKVDGVDASPFYKFGHPILEPYREKTTDIAKLLLKIFEANNVKVIVRNAEKVPKDGPLVVISNHIGINDTLTLYYLDKARGNTDSIILGTQYSKKHFKSIPSVMLVSDPIGSWMVPGAEEQILEKLTEGRALLIFPSGLLGGTKFKDGYLRFAIKTGAAIQPVNVKMRLPWWVSFLRNRFPDLTNALLMVFAWRIYKNNTMVITFGDPIPFSEIKKQTEGQTYIDKRGKLRYNESLLDKHSQLVESLGKQDSIT